MNDHFWSGDAQTQSPNDKAELQEQPRAEDVDEEEKDAPHDWENENRPLLAHLSF